MQKLRNALRALGRWLRLLFLFALVIVPTPLALALSVVLKPRRKPDAALVLRKK